MTIGTELREARERRGLTLDEVARRTKIRPPQLAAIEEDRFDALPGGVFTRGFLKAFAREVGLSPEAIVREYAAQYERVQPAPDPESAAPPESPSPSGFNPLERRLQHSQLIGTVVVALVGTAVYLLLAREAPRRPPPAGPGGSPALVDRAAPEAAVATPAPAVHAGGNAPAEPAAETGTAGDVPDARGVRLEIEPQGPCWVAVSSDGRTAIRRLMNAGDRATVDAREVAVIRVGDAGACAFSVNGERARPVGRPGQPVTVRITRENYRSFLE